MWIRSQNRTILVNVRKIFMKGQGKKEDKFRIVGAGCLGAYSTKEKALKVLDMIQEEILITQHDTVSIINGRVEAIGKDDKVFQMPQDSEVKL